MQDRVLELLSARKGHFLFESGHHGDLWLDLETLCLDPVRLRSLAAALAQPIAKLKPDAVCGPLVEGAFVALLVALELNVPFVYAERFARTSDDGLYPAGYRIPAPQRAELRGKRVAVVNDVTNAGSAVKGAFADLEACGAQVVGIATLLTLGSAVGEFARAKSVPLITLASQPNNLWTPGECPLCKSDVPLEDIAGFASSLAKKS